MGDDREPLTADEAIAMLADGDTVHAFRLCGPALLGADWKREDAVEFIRASGNAERSGPNATAAGYGLCLMVGVTPLFVRTKGAPDARP